MLLGFDIGGTKSAVIIGKKRGEQEIELGERIQIPTRKPPAEMINSLFDTAEEILSRNGFSASDLNGIGISCGGPLSSKRGIILSPPNLPGWDNIPIVEWTQQRFGLKAVLQNDANACAVAEWKYGAGIGVRNMIFLTFGTGMGAGLILNGQLYAGLSDLAGEVGHLRLSSHGPVGFGKSGSFEGFCSGGGIAQLAQIRVREKWQMGERVSFCRNEEELVSLSAKKVAESAYAGDLLAMDIYHTCGQYLGKGLSLLVDMLNPELIVMGSIYTRAQSLLEPAMREVLSRECLSTALADCRILPAALGEQIGDYAALALADMEPG